MDNQQAIAEVRNILDRLTDDHLTDVDYSDQFGYEIDNVMKFSVVPSLETGGFEYLSDAINELADLIEGIPAEDMDPDDIIYTSDILEYYSENSYDCDRALSENAEVSQFDSLIDAIEFAVNMHRRSESIIELIDARDNLVNDLRDEADDLSNGEGDEIQI